MEIPAMSAALYPNVKTITRADYKRMLDCGTRFRNWSINEPANHPKRIFYCVMDERGYCMLNKVAVRPNTQ